MNLNNFKPVYFRMVGPEIYTFRHPDTNKTVVLARGTVVFANTVNFYSLCECRSRIFVRCTKKGKLLERHPYAPTHAEPVAVFTYKKGRVPSQSMNTENIEAGIVQEIFDVADQE